MRLLTLTLLLSGSLVAGCALIEPAPPAASLGRHDTSWRRTTDGWERLPPRRLPPAWYAAALHPVLVGLLLGQVAVGCLIALPDAHRQR